MSATYDMTAAQAMLRELYTDEDVVVAASKKNPFVALVEKNTKFVGDVLVVPVITGPGAGRSGTFADAQSGQAATASEKFNVTRVKDYAVASIDNETMLASATDKGAFVTAVKSEVDSKLRILTGSLATSLYRDGKGSIGVISTISTGVITLTNRADVVPFERRQTLQANATSGGTPRAALGYIIAINRAAGTITVSATAGGAAGTPAGWQATDFILVSGDNNGKISGLAAWLPYVAPVTGDNFFGVDRSVDVTRLAGIRYDGSARPIAEALSYFTSMIYEEGGETDMIFCNTSTFTALEASLSTKVNYIDHKGPADIGFKGIQINGAAGPVSVIADRNCPSTLAYGLQMDTWKLNSLGECPMILKYGAEGDMLARKSDADAVELRMAYYAQLSCKAPGFNGVALLGA